MTCFIEQILAVPLNTNQVTAGEVPRWTKAGRGRSRLPGPTPRGASNTSWETEACPEPGSEPHVGKWPPKHRFTRDAASPTPRPGPRTMEKQNSTRQEAGEAMADGPLETESK